MEEETSEIMEIASHQNLAQIRNELKNIRAQQSAMKKSFKQELEKLQRQLSEIENHGSSERLNQPPSIFPQHRNPNQEKEKQVAQFEPIGYIESVYKQKNGIPRQAGICRGSRSKLAISRQNFSNPHHLLLGLNDFSHVWIIFIFHKNKDGFSATKVKPPRLNGAKVGVFATRSPYRPNAIGLTLAQIDKIEDNVVHLLGADILDGTPVIDIKPYIPEYDSVASCPSHTMCDTEHVNKPYDANVSLAPPLDNLPSLVSSLALSSAAAAAAESSTEDLGCARHLPLKKVGELRQLGKAELYMVDADDNVISASSKYEDAQVTELGTEAVASDDTRRTVRSDCNDVSIMQNNVNIAAMQKCSYIKKCDENTKRTEEHGLIMCGGNSGANGLNSTTDQSVQVAEWIRNPPAIELTVIFTPRATNQLNRFSSQAEDQNYRLCNFETAGDFRTALESILSADPRSIYRRKQCTDRLYYMTLDCVHVTCWFDGDMVEVVKLSPANSAGRTQDCG